MQPPETTPVPSRLKRLAIGAVALIAAFTAAQWLIEALGWPNNFVVMLGVFIVLDLVFMAALNRIVGR